MKRFNAPQPEQVDLNVAKARLRVAAIQAAPSAMIQRHPWGSVIGACASAFAVAGLLGLAHRGEPKSTSSADQPKRKSSGLRFPAGMMQWAITLGMQLVQAHLTKKAAEQTQQAASQQTAPTEEPTHAVG